MMIGTERTMYRIKTLEGYQSMGGVPLNIEVQEHHFVYRNRGSSETLEDYAKYVYQQEARENAMNRGRRIKSPK